jgi:riboflavin synthase alpha subunit
MQCTKVYWRTPTFGVQVGEVDQDGFSVYLIPETLRVTVLGKRQVGDAVNIEIDAQTQVYYVFQMLATTS